MRAWGGSVLLCSMARSGSRAFGRLKMTRWGYRPARDGDSRQYTLIYPQPMTRIGYSRQAQMGNDGWFFFPGYRRPALSRDGCRVDMTG